MGRSPLLIPNMNALCNLCISKGNSPQQQQRGQEIAREQEEDLVFINNEQEMGDYAFPRNTFPQPLSAGCGRFLVPHSENSFYF